MHEMLYTYVVGTDRHYILLSPMLYSWNAISIRMYLVVHSAEEVGVLFGGITLTIICVLLVIQCRRRSEQIFQPPDFRDTYHVS